MGTHDKLDDKFDQAKGKAREAFGDATGDDEQKAKGQAEQAQGKAGEAWEDFKDTADDLKDKITP